MFEERIARGMELLDKRRPTWREEIKGNIPALDMQSGGSCILGLLTGSYLSSESRRLRAPDPSDPARQFRYQVSTDSGFVLDSLDPAYDSPGSIEQAYAVLTAEWKAALNG